MTTPHAVLLRVADSFDIAVAVLISSNRTRYVSHARQAAAWCIRAAYPDLSLTMIGNLLGGRDHTTIGYAIGQVQLRMAADPALAMQLRTIIAPDRRVARVASDRVFWGVTVARTA